MADADPDWWVGLGDEYEEERPLAQASLSASRTLNRAAAELRELRISEQTAGAGQKPASELHHSVSSSSVACSSLLNNSLRDGSAANHQRAHALGTHAPVTSPGFPPRKRQCPAVASPADLSCAALSQSQSMPSAVCDEKGPSSRLLRQIEWLLASRTDNADDTDARFSAAIEGIVEEATKRVSTAEKAAADAQNESSRLALLLQAAPSPEALGVQVANAREARAAQREAEAKLRLCMKKLQAVEREALDQGVVLSKATPSGRPAPQDAANRKASDTALRRYHRAGCSSRTYPVAPGSIQGQGQQGADLSTSCASSHKAAMPEIDEHTRALVRFYHDVASVVGSRSANLPPNPDRIKEVLDIVRNVEAASKRFKDLEEALSRCQSALSSRDMASVRVDTPQDVANEVERMVTEETRRAATSHAEEASEYVLDELRHELGVKNLSDVLIRVHQLGEALNRSLAVFAQLRVALGLNANATVQECIGAASQVQATCKRSVTLLHLLCGELQVNSPDAVYPAVRRLVAQCEHDV